MDKQEVIEIVTATVEAIQKPMNKLAEPVVDDAMVKNCALRALTNALDGIGWPRESAILRPIREILKAQIKALLE